MRYFPFLSSCSQLIFVVIDAGAWAGRWSPSEHTANKTAQLQLQLLRIRHGVMTSTSGVHVTGSDVISGARWSALRRRGFVIAIILRLFSPYRSSFFLYLTVSVSSLSYDSFYKSVCFRRFSSDFDGCTHCSCNEQWHVYRHHFCFRQIYVACLFIFKQHARDCAVGSLFSQVLTIQV